MASITVKRVYEQPEDTDGLRVLVDRLWPRGVSKERAAVDLWSKDVAPSPELRRWFGHDPERFSEFSARYEDELASSSAAAAFLDTCREKLASNRNVTLLYAAKDPACNHALVLKAWLERGLDSSGK